MNGFENAARAALPAINTTALRRVAARISDGWPDGAILSSLGARDAELVAPILRARSTTPASAAEAAAYLRGLAAACDSLSTALTVETVWTGPASHAVPVRSTAQALIELVDEAHGELILMTYSAKPHDRLRNALTAASARGVTMTVVVETLQGAGGAIAGSEPAAAFRDVAGVELWHWPVAARVETGGKMHAKLAIADRQAMLVSSANLTESGVSRNIEAGLLVRGGTAPQRAAEHIGELKARGVLQCLR